MNKQVSKQIKGLQLGDLAQVDWFDSYMLVSLLKLDSNTSLEITLTEAKYSARGNKKTLGYP